MLERLDNYFLHKDPQKENISDIVLLLQENMNSILLDKKMLTLVTLMRVLFIFL